MFRSTLRNLLAAAVFASAAATPAAAQDKVLNLYSARH